MNIWLDYGMDLQSVAFTSVNSLFSFGRRLFVISRCKVSNDRQVFSFYRNLLASIRHKVIVSMSVVLFDRIRFVNSRCEVSIGRQVFSFYHSVVVTGRYLVLKKAIRVVVGSLFVCYPASGRRVSESSLNFSLTDVL